MRTSEVEILFDITMVMPARCEKIMMCCCVAAWCFSSTLPVFLFLAPFARKLEPYTLRLSRYSIAIDADCTKKLYTPRRVIIGNVALRKNNSMKAYKQAQHAENVEEASQSEERLIGSVYGRIVVINTVHCHFLRLPLHARASVIHEQRASLSVPCC